MWILFPQLVEFLMININMPIYTIQNIAQRLEGYVKHLVYFNIIYDDYFLDILRKEDVYAADECMV